MRPDRVVIGTDDERASEVLREEGVDVSAGINNPQDRQFFRDAFDALSAVPNYGSPFYLQLTDFTQVEATGLQITRSPGKNLVYLGCVLLIPWIYRLIVLPPYPLMHFAGSNVFGIWSTFMITCVSKRCCLTVSGRRSAVTSRRTSPAPAWGWSFVMRMPSATGSGKQTGHVLKAREADT